MAPKAWADEVLAQMNEEGGLRRPDEHDKNLLVELFVEELPPKALKKLGEAFAGVLADSLKAQGLAAPMRRDAVRLAAPAGRARDAACRQGRRQGRCSKS
jgi:hypothetical protein